MAGWPWWGNLLAFAVAAAAIWWAGTRLERYADVIARRTGLGHAFTGMLLLAAATSMPEVATTITAIVILDNPSLAVHNLLGAVALQIGILALADGVARKRGALTYFSPRFVLLVEGVGLVLLLQIAVVGLTGGGVPTVLSISAWSVVLAAAYVAMMYLVHRYRGQPRWTPTQADDVPEGAPPPEPDDADRDGRSLRSIWIRFGAMSLIVLAGGWLAAQAADSLAEQSGLGSAFLGATLLAAASSLPEISTTFAASRHGRYTVAISNVFGSGAFNVTLLVVADVLYRGGSVLAHAEHTLVFIAAIATIMTCLYLWGLLEREDRVVWRLGWDSIAAVLTYVGGMTVLYFIQ